MKPFRVCLSCAAAAAAAAALVVPLRAADPRARFAKYADISGVLDAVHDALPLELQALPSLAPDAQWDSWISGHDTEIRARLAQGDEDTLVNWLLYGTSFTAEPRAVMPDTSIAQTDPAAVRKLADLVNARVIDFLRALRAPGMDERRLFARRFFEGNGFKLATADGINELGNHLLVAIERVAAEESALGEELEAAKAANDPEKEVAVRSRLYRTRGLSLDTSLGPNYAVEQALVAMMKRNLVKPGSVTRVAIVGPGLDFMDRDAGLDQYPLQTVQPFAVIDSLRKLELTPAGSTPDVVCLDISPRVADHVMRARARASRGLGYTLSLPLARAKPWTPEFRDYWKTLGQRIGTPAPAPVDRTAAARVDLRTIRVPAATVQHVSVADLDIVTERLADTRFDLVIATNVLVYYDILDQALAFANVEAMLKNGGFLLTNTVLPEIEWVPLEFVDSTTSVYDTTGTGDQVLWYQRMAGTVTIGK